METIDASAFAGSPYEPIVAQAEAFRKRFEAQSAGPEVTTRAIVHASLAARPRVRYVVPRSAALMLSILALLPTRLIDLVMRHFAGLTKKNLPANTPSRTLSAPAA